MNYLFNLRLFYGLAVFADYPAKRSIYGLLVYYPAVENQGEKAYPADSSSGGLPGLAVERLGAVTTGSSRCTGSLPYPDATLYSPTLLDWKSRLLKKEEATALSLKDKAMALTRSYSAMLRYLWCYLRPVLGRMLAIFIIRFPHTGHLAV